MKLGILYCSIFILMGCSEPANKQRIATVESTYSKGTPVLDTSRYNVGFLIMEGTYNTELTAPFDIFQHTIYRDSIKAMNVFLVANTLKPIRTFEGIYLLPDFDYTQSNRPKIDILVIPSAAHHLDSDLENKALISYVQEVATEAEYITSHCDGAFVLAKAGLLENTITTTFPSDIDTMREMFPTLDIREDVLFVHDGKYITSAGGAKSFEAALYLSEHLYGAAIARSLAKGLVIDWDLREVPHLIVPSRDNKNFQPKNKPSAIN